LSIRRSVLHLARTQSDAMFVVWLVLLKRRFMAPLPGRSIGIARRSF
jgi:hypothetical protein